MALGALLAEAFGVMRFQHLRRSRPVSRSTAGVWFRAYRGKQAQRAAVDWFLPACGLTGLRLADALWDAWHTEHRRRKRAGRGVQSPLTNLSFDIITGNAIGLAAATNVAREALQESAENPGSITTYSFRRFLPTLADIGARRGTRGLLSEGGRRTLPVRGKPPAGATSCPSRTQAGERTPKLR